MGFVFVDGKGHCHDVTPMSGNVATAGEVFNIIDRLKAAGSLVEPVSDQLCIDKFIPMTRYMCDSAGLVYDLDAALMGYSPGTGGTVKEVFSFDHEPTEDELAALRALKKPLIIIRTDIAGITEV